MRFVLLAIFAACAFAQNDWTVVPGVRVGPIRLDGSRDGLARLFPPGAVTEDEMELDEGVVQKATFVYREEKSRTLAISWRPDGHIRQIFVCWGRRRGDCRWQVAGGIKFGTRLRELEAMNATPLTVSGFGYNYGGNVLSWNGGRLAKLDCGGHVVLTLDGDRDADGDLTVALSREENHSISGDRPIPSSTPAFQKVNPRVTGILVQAPAPGERSCAGQP